MRGTLPGASPESPPTRFIPAHAGNTGVESSECAAKAVHPRACGEHERISAAAMSASGSSPRMRGTLLLGLFLSATHRFIPAHAGNTGV
ncbi:protein of unknown function [Denitratisoma oestradiolicum]|uniref:Uncharacterized protein n=1 Tax=Denitratisoma oestradiolicum TaxID=311182 RepID=A0A6S6XQ64_9PROT|nr:protein of unknown function [Denitratisoma oestradiolicum]